MAADDAEDAYNRTEFYLNLEIGKVREKAKIDLSNPSQECFTCGGETESTRHRWCSDKCRKVWEKENE